MRSRTVRLSFLICAVAALLAGPGVAGPTVIDPGGKEANGAFVRIPLADRGDCGSESLTQSSAPDVIGAATVICGDSETSLDFSLAREFIAPYPLSLECVTFGVRLNTGGDWPATVRILSGEITGPYDALLLRREAKIVIPKGTTSEFFTVSLPSLQLAAGEAFIVELRSPSRAIGDGGDGAILGFGCNVQSQTAPSYFRGPACAEPDFVDLADIGFGGRHLVMTLGVEPVSPPSNDSPRTAPLVQLGEAATFTTIGATSDGPAESCASDQDVWFVLQAGSESTLNIGILADDGADIAMALFDIGPDGIFDPGDLGDLLVGCVDTPTPGEETAVFTVTPGNFYLLQIGNGIIGGGNGGGATGGVINVPDPGTPAFDFPLPACVPCVGCVQMTFRESYALRSLGVVSAVSCSDCPPPPVPPCPCLDDVSHLIAYWPMEELTPGWGTDLTPDLIGADDLALPCTFAGPSGCTPDYAQVIGVRGNALSLTANAFNGAAALPFPTSGALPDVGTGPFTVSAWILRQPGVTNNVVMSAGSTTGWSVTVQSTGEITLDITSDSCPSGGSTVTVTRSSTGTVPSGVWTHIAVVVSKYSANNGCLAGGGVAFYIDGALDSVTDLSGLYFDCRSIQYFVGGPKVQLDEVMIFDRVLNAARIQDIYAKAVIGPCEFSIRQTPIVECTGPSAQLDICNIFGPDQFFNYTLAPLPGACTIGVGPAAGTVFVQHGSCVTIPITLSGLGCVTNTTSAQWIASVSDSGSPPRSKAAVSRVRCEYVTIGSGGSGGGFLGLRAGDPPADLVLDITNVSGAPLTATYSLAVTNADGDPDAEVFAIDGLPPGEPVLGVLNLPAGGDTQLPISLEALSVDVLGFYELTLSIDINGGANFEPSGTLGLQALPIPIPPPCIGDTNGDGVVDFGDLNFLLSAFNTAPPDPLYMPQADLDGDGDVDFGDLNTLLGVFNTSC